MITHHSIFATNQSQPFIDTNHSSHNNAAMNEDNDLTLTAAAAIYIQSLQMDSYVNMSVGMNMTVNMAMAMTDNINDDVGNDVGNDGDTISRQSMAADDILDGSNADDRNDGKNDDYLRHLLGCVYDDISGMVTANSNLSCDESTKEIPKQRSVDDNGDDNTDMSRCQQLCGDECCECIYGDDNRCGNDLSDDCCDECESIGSWVCPMLPPTFVQFSNIAPPQFTYFQIRQRCDSVPNSVTSSQRMDDSQLYHCMFGSDDTSIISECIPPPNSILFGSSYKPTADIFTATNPSIDYRSFSKLLDASLTPYHDLGWADKPLPFESGLLTDETTWVGDIHQDDREHFQPSLMATALSQNAMKDEQPMQHLSLEPMESSVTAVAPPPPMSMAHQMSPYLSAYQHSLKSESADCVNANGCTNANTNIRLYRSQLPTDDLPLTPFNHIQYQSITTHIHSNTTSTVTATATQNKPSVHKPKDGDTHTMEVCSLKSSTVEGRSSIVADRSHAYATSYKQKTSQREYDDEQQLIRQLIGPVYDDIFDLDDEFETQCTRGASIPMAAAEIAVATNHLPPLADIWEHYKVAPTAVASAVLDKHKPYIVDDESISPEYEEEEDEINFIPDIPEHNHTFPHSSINHSSMYQYDNSNHTLTFIPVTG